METLRNRIEKLVTHNFLTKRRILTIGDEDLTEVAAAIFGQPKEVVTVGIDKRLSEVLFEATTEFDIPVRFVYHDMRLKLIEILQDQYELVIMEPPHQKAGIEVFISRASQIIQLGFEDRVFISASSQGEIRKVFVAYLKRIQVEIINLRPHSNEYTGSNETSDFIQLKLKEGTPVVTVPRHWIRPFYSHEEIQPIQSYHCICGELIDVGISQQFKNLEELQKSGHSCGRKDVFAYVSRVKLL